MTGRLLPLGDDWYEWRQRPALGADVQVHVTTQADGRLALTGLRIVGEPTSGLLRAIPLGRIEAAANAQLGSLGNAVTPTPRHRSPERTAPARRPPEPLTGDAGWGHPDQPPPSPRGRSPQGQRGRPDSFYAEIALAYGELAQVSRRPAADLAERHGVPVTTAHRWIKEARRRGHLTPGRPGKAG